MQAERMHRLGWGSIFGPGGLGACRRPSDLLHQLQMLQWHNSGHLLPLTSDRNWHLLFFIYRCWGPGWDAWAYRSHFPTSLRRKPMPRMADLGPPWHCWDTQSTNSEPPISWFPDTWENKFIFKAGLSWDFCYRSWFPPFLGTAASPRGHSARRDLACEAKNSCLMPDAAGFSIILSPFFNYTCPSLIARPAPSQFVYVF